MFHSTADSASPTWQTIDEFPEFKHKVALVCCQCGRKAKYKVGRIFIDPQKKRREKDEAGSFEEDVCFSGLFRCKYCGASGPWEFPTGTHMQLMAFLLMGLSGRANSQIHVGRLQMFDGTSMQTGAASEDYLKQKIEEHPDDAFLWDRLGNLYDNAGEIDLARSAYEKAIQLDPGEIEANYTLGCYRMNEGDWVGAAECFQRIVLHARTAPRRNPELLETIVRDAIERLFDLHCESEGEILFPPQFDTLPPTMSPQDEPNVISLIEMDFSTDEGWDILTSICLTGNVPEHICSRERNRPELEGFNIAGESRRPLRVQNELSGTEILERNRTPEHGNRRVGRNAPCPCGSEKKYKRCCGRS